ncbi:hypothetical protein KJ671_01210 [Patescibacteria group bacterium]|nr:hypothetical protein [Patescibacteria group bacterium]
MIDQKQTIEISEPKISITEIVFITPFYLISDAIDLILFFFALDDFGIMDLTRTSISQFYFVVIKKMGPEVWLTNLAVNGIKVIPYIGSLVPSTFLWFTIIFLDRSGGTKIGKVVEKIKKARKITKPVSKK